MWPLETEPSLFSEHAPSAWKRVPVRDGLTHHPHSHLGDESLLQILPAMHLTHA